MFPVEDPDIMLEEVKRKVFSAKLWKALGLDGLPAIVWRQLWPIVQEEILDLFKASLDEGILPRQWREAKIIPLKKRNKPDYRYAKAWRPISLLPTLGKIFEAVLAERISYVAERYNLLPENHFGARSRRSAEQALTLLQESIYTSWRRGQVLSLVSFDVKGAYNGVYAPRLIQRLRARRIPERLLRWIKAFCTDRSASLTLNGRESDVRPILFPGLPQGSPLSPVLFLFYNADLVEQRISNREGAIAFVDDYTAWVVGESAVANTAKIRSIVDRALAWESRSGATFEGEKTALVHFTRNSRLRAMRIERKRGTSCSYVVANMRQVVACGMSRPLKRREGFRIPWFSAITPSIAKVSTDASFQLCNSSQSCPGQHISKKCVSLNGALAVLVIHQQRHMLFSLGQPSLNHPFICTVNTPTSTSLITFGGLRKLDSAPPYSEA